jgi:MarR family transcriptional regulator for hemolysin
MPSDTSPESLGFLLAEIARLVRGGLERRVARIGLELTPGEARALAHVAANEGARQTVIAERMGVEPMTVCAYLDRLEKLGLVTRTADPTDRRAKQIHITEQAAETLASIRREASALYEGAQAGLGPAEREALLIALKILRNNLHAALGERPGAAMQPAVGGIGE